MKDCFWSIYNTVDETRVDGLRTVQLKSLMRTIERASLDEWLIWEEGTQDWKRAAEVLPLFQGSVELHRLPPVPPPLDKVSTDVPAATMLFHETVEDEQKPVTGTKGPVDERSSPRFLMSFKVFINFQGRVITNTTTNVSVGGMKLKHSLPADISGSFDVTMVNGNVELGMRCRALKTVEEENITRLLIEHCNRMDLLRQWLVRDKNEAS